MESSIITISREYGSGGREIARKTAERLGIPFYDRDLIDKAAKESGFTPEFVAEREQRLGSNFLYNFALGGIYGLAYPRKPEMKELPVAEQIFLAQKKVIEDLAEQGPCIFVGRCADYILRNKPKVLKVFVYADPKARICRAVEKYGQMEEQAEEIAKIMKKALKKENLTVKVEKLKNKKVSSMITVSEESRRMQDMMRMYAVNGMDMGFGQEGETLVLNASHPLVEYVLDHKEGDNVEMICEQLYDLALLQNAPLKPEAMTKFIARSNDIMLLLTK